jgi:hypothetical protein
MTLAQTMSYEIPPWTYTFLSDYENCPKKAFHKHVAKDIPKEPETDAQKRGIEVHKAMERRLTVGAPLPKDMVQWEPYAVTLSKLPIEAELKMGITPEGKIVSFFGNGVKPWGRVVIDVLTHHQDIAYLLDWKTGKLREDPFELRIQALFVQARHPNITKIRGQYMWLQDNKLGDMHELSDTRSTWATICGHMGTVVNNARMGHWPARENPLCKWCPVKACQFNKNR